MIIKFNVMGDHRGQLIALEENQNIPFDIKRVFYIYGTLDGVKRGEHSHYKTSQILIAVSGYCKVTLDDGKTKTTYSLDKPNIGLLQKPLVWGTMHGFSDDCVLLVLSDTYYDESDYIRNYSEFKKHIDRIDSHEI